MNRNSARDRAIERLLRGARQPRAASVRGACFDIDTLAAWSEGALGPEDRAAAEAHAADCPRCQALVAAMARTNAPPETAAGWRRPALAWLVPLTAGAAALVIWIAIPAERQQPVATVSVADSRQQPQAPAPPVEARAARQTNPSSEAATRQKAADEKTRRAEPLQRDDAERSRYLDKFEPAARRVSPSAPATKEESKTASAAERAATANETGAASSPPVAVPPPVAAPAPVGAPAAKTMGALMARPPVEIVSSNPGSRWRIIAGGGVQRSMDGGSTWELQQTDVAATLTAGASPSPSVCWLVGPGGIVLLSTDGRSWRRVPFPESADLASVTATDAQTATVTSTDGRVFRTADGGLTWSR